MWIGTGKCSWNIFGITNNPKSSFFFADLASENPKMASSCALKWIHLNNDYRMIVNEYAD